MLTFDEHDALGRETCWLSSIWTAIECMTHRVYGKSDRLSRALLSLDRAFGMLRSLLDDRVCAETPRSAGNRCTTLYYNNTPPHLATTPEMMLMREPTYGATPEQMRARPLTRRFTTTQAAIVTQAITETYAYCQRVYALQYLVEYYTMFRASRQLHAVLNRIATLMHYHPAPE